MKSLSRPTALLALALCATPVLAAPEADAEQLRAATIKLINMLVEQGVLTREKADALLAEANKPGPVRVPYMPEFQRKELKDEVELDLAARAAREGWAKPGSVPAWVRSLEWEGDLRTRYQYDDYASSNSPAAFFTNVTETNRQRLEVSPATTTEDRTRFRVRARAGLTAKVDEHWAAGLRLTTGSSSDPISSNQTLGNYGNRFTVAFDRAYVRGKRGNFSAVLGRFGNPWFSTDLVWANDLGFDGLALQWTPELTAEWQGFATLGATPIQEVELSREDKWLYGLQAGVTRLGTAERMGARFGLAYYHYDNIVGEYSTPGTSDREYTAVQFAQKGNTYFNVSSSTDPLRPLPLLALASEFRLVNLTGQVDFPVPGGRRVAITGDYVRNIGFDRARVSERVGRDVAPETTGYQIRVAFGSPEMKAAHDWQASMAYKRLERDAVVDAYTDGDFRLGGTDAKGYILGLSYGVGKNTAASVRYFSGDAISGAPLSIDVLQVELNVRF
ncbi:putative porin [Piscinibacter sp. HJYY11]|uniref:putative porin n=1 Tax=Piscinibacter sp. HJYY11 TaxID=2801333 RepID=UPI00191FC8C3|nr:putative porin [Piscinibacter sp. HJYY11]MBL0726191.1 putative porin [Piscinibacter sp. HJYY11]